ncbi:DUF1054 family protein [Lactiplantibacillus plajomi]|uniref:UPF0637 protein ACFFGS_13230 n=1 Tax=Lactiplantibacillus plajomi TaxID=1457217 RepID=A0ABV6K7B1_9LACO|nr:DUF1054 family protein [Lactiplantibacillus plajomi]
MFTRSDFDIFNDPTLAGRMHLIKTVIDPKFEALAPQLVTELTAVTGQPFYAHVAKHLRRFKNPPVDTWVAFSHNQRGYKGWPHFELGLWPDRLFLYLDVLDECKPKVQAALTPADLTTIFTPVAPELQLATNHGQPLTRAATANNVQAALAKFQRYKHSELVVGRSWAVDDPQFDHPAEWATVLTATLNELVPVYQPLMAAVRQPK